MSYLLWEFARAPERQDKLRKEVEQFSDPTYDDVQSGMPYLDASVREM